MTLDEGAGITALVGLGGLALIVIWFLVKVVRLLLKELIEIAARAAERLRAWISRERWRLALGASLFGTFVCWWIAADEDRGGALTLGQWRLVGWTLLATAGAIYWRLRGSTSRPLK